MLDNSSQLLLRHQLVDHETLLVNAPDALAREAKCLAHFYYFNLWHRYALPTHQFGAVLQQRASATVLYVPKEKNLARMLLANLAHSLVPSDTLYLVGGNKSGIKALAKQLGDDWHPAQKIASGNHCLLYRTQLKDAKAGHFELADYRSIYQLNQPEITVVNLPGVFSEQKLDAGTALLLQHFPAEMQGKVLDFACGSGVLAASIATRFPGITHISASDVNAFAIEACKQTLSQVKPADSQIVASDGLDQIEGRFDWIISNPPFHTGQRTDYSIARDFIRSVPAHLTASGRLLLVANNFLGYPELLREQFRNVREIVNNGRFHILEASQPC
ncbi:16S rRNA methyltransferase [Aliidiomarina sedimenti]|uniref:Ribosomal RNA small subunit methyltransferase C n=1 Tax=Aliidiomarina sedimenti TaxID=1933879 RepID=A0ABY0BYP3_9GAMM|nr:methyltransferase [Aliidiomarina sedimenti]RUO29806.1 16S rRNA methyltransferase [Aliidiomarina sedimenti]